MARTTHTVIGSKIGLMPTLVLTVAAMYVARDVLIPLAVAVLLAFLLTPAVTWLQRWHLGRLLSIILVVGACLSVVGSITWVVEQQFVEVGCSFPNTARTFRTNCAKFEVPLRAVSSALPRVSKPR